MKKFIAFLHTIPGVTFITISILVIPLIAMQFSTHVNWSFSDFIIMGVMIFMTGSSYVLITRYAPNITYRLAMGSVIGFTFLLVWINLAVGLIGSGPHIGNLLYMGVIVVILVGTYLSDFKTIGMARAMFAVVISLGIVAGIQFFLGIQNYPGSSVEEIIAVNGFFMMLYAVSSLIFKYAALNESETKATDLKSNCEE